MVDAGRFAVLVPLPVAPHLAQHVLTDLVPEPVGIGGDEGGGDGVVGRLHEHLRLDAGGLALALVEGGQVVAAFGEHPDAEADGSTHRGRSTSAHEEHRATRRVGHGRHPAGPALVLERLAGPRLLHDLHRLLEPATALGERLTEHLELGRPVARADDVGDPSLREEVDDRHGLGQGDRVVQRRRSARPPGCARVGRTGGHGRDQRERGGQVAVVDAVVLGDHDGERRRSRRPSGPCRARLRSARHERCACRT